MNTLVQQTAALVGSALTIATACGTDKRVDVAAFCAEVPTHPECQNLSPAPPVASCDPGTAPDAAAGVFVAPGGSDTSGDGSRERPYATVAKAVAVGKANVYVAQGTYTVEATVELSSSVTIDGGWTSSWQRACGAPEKTTLRGSSLVSTVLRTQQSAVALVHLSIQTADPAPPLTANQPGLSRITLHARGGSLALEDTLVFAGSAGDGGAAPPGQAGQGIAPCNDQSDCLPNPFIKDDATPGKSGAKGDNAPATVPAIAGPGIFQPHGYEPANGALGQPGQPGQPGQRAPVTTPFPEKAICVVSTCQSPEAMQSASACQQAGSTTIVNTDAKLCGCGGQPGGPGFGGPGGGVSLALFAVDAAQIQIKQSKLQSSSGGRGATGSQGGTGANGQEDPSDSDRCTAKNDTTSTVCGWASNACGDVGTTTTTTTTTTTAKGGPGGKGGDGGPGGPGAGGPSIGIVTVGGATVQIDPSVTITPGQGGLGGDGQTRAESAPQKAY